jgi:adenylate cyclase
MPAPARRDTERVDARKRERVLFSRRLSVVLGSRPTSWETDVQALYRFASCEFEPSSGVVRRGHAAPSELRPKAAEVAKFLLDNAGQVVSRDALMAAVWRDVFVTDDSITQAIVQFRRALGEDGNLLRTLPRRGYLLDAEVTRVAEGTPTPQPAPVAAGPRRSGTDEAKPSIAVLPFAVHGPDGADPWFAQGVIEGIIHVLSGLRDIVVVSQASSLAAVAREADDRRIAALLGVRYLLRGTAARSAEALRLTAQLIEAERGHVLHSARLEGRSADVFGMQDQIAEQVVTAIAPTVRQQELRLAMRKPPESLTAYDRVLQALELMPRLDPPLYDLAGHLLTEAVALDPRYAPASAYAALWHMIRIAQGWSTDAGSDAAAAQRYAGQALASDGQNAWALAIEGHLISYTRRAFDEAAMVLDHAIVCGPNNPLAWAFRSATSGYLGDGPRALREAAYALRLSPLDPFGYLVEHFMSLAHYVCGDMEAAIQWARKVCAHSPRHAANLRLLISGLVASGSVAEARDVAAQYRVMHPEFRIAPFAARTPLCGAHFAGFNDHLREAGLPD